MWRVTVDSVSDLPRMDLLSDTDPILTVQLTTPGRPLNPLAITPVIWNNNCANFDVGLDFGQLQCGLDRVLWEHLTTLFGQKIHPRLFCKDASDEDFEGETFETFLQHVKCFEHLVEDESEEV
eukprot:TRINITY_DN15879_c0_g1_i1.p1 TRINITY_DN15879_c0_g1~~TRINITY_DN15879_c0_g1_i1.p1  ORF type:complete len:123 (+),score=17.75 TRINITY_DN15879_c0_g1_i1:575-943(+)